MRIAIMGDFHYPRMQHAGNELLKARESFFGGMLERFMAIEADLHVSLGDLTNEGTEDELGYVFGKIRSLGGGNSFVHTLGNHDTYWMPKADILAITGQLRYRAIETDEAVVLVLDTTREMNPADWGGELDPMQLEWLDGQVRRSERKPLLVFAHHPVYGTTARSTISKLSIDPNIDIRSILSKKQGFGVYFCGHNHQHSIVREGNWHFVQTAAVLDVPAFRIAEVRDGALSVETVRVRDEELQRLARLIGGNMVYFGLHAEADGDPADHALRVDERILERR
ncbi:metallophosphoesterase family protein [Paenibacillus flagellatus]|nr:metallophosphoesterase [Paenibacillus flagellatus]